MKKYAFWNNKGGTGKTSLAFQAAAIYAEQHSEEEVLVLDLCPQANLSELFLGGLMGGGSEHLTQLQSESPRRTVGGYFEARLPAPYTVPNINPKEFLSRPSEYNNSITDNIQLLAGDPLLELQSNAIATLANAQIPGQKPWLAVADWIRDFVHLVEDDFDTVFIDTNPSFSMYTQIALSAAEMLVLPVMADDSSRRAIQNAFALIHGIKLPSMIYSDYSFTKKLTDAGRELPKVHLLPKNRLTQYMGPASAYGSVMGEIEGFVEEILLSNSEVFTFSTKSEGFVDVRDFQTTGVVAFAEGKPFSKLRTGTHNIGGRLTQVSAQYLEHCRDAINNVVRRL
ncbi:ParA family protein [Bremerella cremea]|uniref:ParA family protein n=1 Tax=Bremerella cremea TaxID=1031537 RepID=A0A368KR03_9BACT|nr:ParA family protein [Bremerella cremea]RCS44719.1 ParA family protein [Bremerella cremea]